MKAECGKGKCGMREGQGMNAECGKGKCGMPLRVSEV